MMKVLRRRGLEGGGSNSGNRIGGGRVGVRKCNNHHSASHHIIGLGFHHLVRAPQQSIRQRAIGKETQTNHHRIIFSFLSRPFHLAFLFHDSMLPPFLSPPMWA